MPCPPHPYGIQPWGNYLIQGGPNIRDQGLGLAAALSDELLCTILYLLPAGDLARLAVASKSFYCFCHNEDFWKGLVLEELNGEFDWCGSWRETYLVHAAPGYTPGSHQPLEVHGFYSDLLHQPWACAHTELQPEWLEVENIDRRSGLTQEAFLQQYELPGRPVILTDVVPTWPAATSWNRQHLAQALAGREVLVGNAPMRFKAYLDYCDNNHDEMPLYLFDKHFGLKAPWLAAEYTVPHFFQDDMFAVLGEEARPDYRWLIMGPRRSGSSFHVDPNATSAWNAVVSGAKKWLLYPPGSLPPGVHPSPDGADVATPVSLMEWFINFYDATREGKVRPLEGVVRPGELLFIPHGWWHAALNLDDSIAVTQNYASRAHLDQVLAFLRPGHAALVSGCSWEQRSSLYHRFVAVLQEKRPEVWEELQQEERKKQQQRDAQHALSALFKAAAPNSDGSQFGFGFSFQLGSGEADKQSGAGASAGLAIAVPGPSETSPVCNREGGGAPPVAAGLRQRSCAATCVDGEVSLHHPTRKTHQSSRMSGNVRRRTSGAGMCRPESPSSERC